jgi:hypothetical protein
MEVPVQLTRQRADIVVPGALLTVLLGLGFFARPLIIPVAAIGGFALWLFYAARDATGNE